MTARDQARFRDARLGERERSVAIPAEPTATLGETLHAARERKGVDLFRAERDTKIRVKYLAALERSDFSQLPGTVYTRGFLRNYALYLGLDSEEILGQFQREVGSTRPVKRVVIAPRPLDAPRRGLTFTPGVLVAAVMTLAILAFAGYIALQLMRFAQPPLLTVNQPAVNPVAADVEQFTLSGESDPSATIEITGPGQQTHRFPAAADGTWKRVVAVNKGRNDFVVVATDPVTSKLSPPLNVIVQVPIPPGPEAPTLDVMSPNDGTEFTNGAIPITGTTNGAQVTVTAEFEPAAPVAPLPSAGASPGPSVPAVPPAVPSAGPTGPASPGPSPPPQPAPKQIVVAEDGAFSDAYQLAPGRWTVTITATSVQNKKTTEKRTITVAFTGVNLRVEIRDTAAWIKVWVDGQIAPGYESGAVLPAGRSAEFTARSRIEVRTGSSGSTFFTLNGTPLRALGPRGVPETWLFQPTGPPEKTGRTR
jgi:cytoskeletal protein RodZ